jgi:hypothetical protein
MDPYIYTNSQSINKDLCVRIMNMFEEQEEGKYDGLTHGGLNKKVKDTKDYVIDNKDEKWSKVHKFLKDELNRNLKIYLDNLNKNPIFDDKELTNIKYSYFDGTRMMSKTFMVQKYKKQEGRYIFHNDYSVENNPDRDIKYRAITYLWYLNNVEEGGETEFSNNMKIKPEQGKLLLFPATWTYVHRGKMPISDDKYIITGWLYSSFP